MLTNAILEARFLGLAEAALETLGRGTPELGAVGLWLVVVRGHLWRSRQPVPQETIPVFGENVANFPRVPIRGPA